MPPIFTTTREVKEGEELFYHYGVNYWRAKEQVTIELARDSGSNSGSDRGRGQLFRVLALFEGMYNSTKATADDFAEQQLKLVLPTPQKIYQLWAHVEKIIFTLMLTHIDEWIIALKRLGVNIDTEGVQEKDLSSEPLVPLVPLTKTTSEYFTKCASVGWAI